MSFTIVPSRLAVTLRFAAVLSPISGMASISPNNAKKKQLTLYEMLSSKNTPSSKQYENNNFNNKKTGGPANYWIFQYNAIKNAIRLIVEKFQSQDSADMVPTIDCYSSDTFCKKRLMKGSFVSSKYDDPSKWADEVAWCNPPYEKNQVMQAIKLFEKRRMRGYVSVPYYPHPHPKYSTQDWLFRTQTRKCKASINIKGKGAKSIYKSNRPCPFDTIILYFDFRK